MTNTQTNDYVSVLALLPFWRYAVGPTSRNSTALPFYRKSSAEAFFNEAKRDLPWAGVCLYRRAGWSGIETVQEYKP